MVKNPPVNAGDKRDEGLTPGSGRSPVGGNGNPLQYACLENSVNRGAWGPKVYGITESGMTECTYIHTHTRQSPPPFCILSTQWALLICQLWKTTLHYLFNHFLASISLLSFKIFLSYIPFSSFFCSTLWKISMTISFSIKSDFFTRNFVLFSRALFSSLVIYFKT